MPVSDDVRLARLVLKKGWLTRTALQQALGQVKKLRNRHPDLTLLRYLEAKKLLSPERLAALREPFPLQPWEQPAPRVHAPLGPRGWSRSVPTRRARTGRSNGIIVAGAVIAAAVIIALWCLPGSSEDGPKKPAGVRRLAGARSATRTRPPRKRREPQKPSATIAPELEPPAPPATQAPSEEDGLLKRIQAADGEPARQFDLVAQFVERFPDSELRIEVDTIERSLRSRARQDLRELRARRSELQKQRRFREIVDAYRSFEERWEGTEAGAQASEARFAVETVWSRAAEFAWKHTRRLVEAGRLGQAFADLTELKKWCPDHVGTSVDEAMKELLTASASPDTPRRQWEKLSEGAWKKHQQDIDREIARLDQEEQKKRAARRARNEVPWTAGEMVVLKVEATKRIKDAVTPDSVRQTLLATELKESDPRFRMVPADSETDHYDYLVRLVSEAKYVGKSQFYGAVTISHTWKGQARLEVLAPGTTTVLYHLEGDTVKDAFRLAEEGGEGILNAAIKKFLEKLRRTPGWRLKPRQA